MKNQIERAEPSRGAPSALSALDTCLNAGHMSAIPPKGEDYMGIKRSEAPTGTEPSRGAPDAQRKAFEEWAAEAYGGDITKYLVRDPLFPDEYKPDDIQWAWKAWKAWEESVNRAAVLLEALKGYVNWFGPAHDPDCPEDDTCDCTGKPINDAVNAAIKQAERT